MQKKEDNASFGLLPKSSKDALELQRTSFDQIRLGKQSKLPVKKVNKTEIERGIKLSIDREKARLKKEKMHFYVLDCETTGKQKPEPIVIAACRYEKGKPTVPLKMKVMPEGEITEEAEKVHGISKRLLGA